MSGGFFTIAGSKIKPGVYIKYKTQSGLPPSIGERGICTLATLLDWGKMGSLIEITDINNIDSLLGYSITHEKMLFLREITRGTNLTAGASKIYIYRLDEINPKKAKLTIGNCNIEAKYEGLRGNDISIIISPLLDTKDKAEEIYYKWKIEVLVDNMIVESFTKGIFIDVDSEENKEALVEDFVNIESNWVNISGKGNLENSLATFLSGGEKGEPANIGHNNYLKELEKINFNAVIYDGSDIVLKSAYKNFVKRMCTEEGRYCVGIISNYNADSEYIININQGFKNEEGIELTPEQATWFVGGSESGANYNESLTYKVIPGATEIYPEFSNTDLEKNMLKGILLFTKFQNQVVILSDINSFTSITEDKGPQLKKNRIMRTIMQICNDMYNGYMSNYIGKIDVNDNGTNLIKKYGINYLETIQANNGIQEFNKDDFIVKQFDHESMEIAFNIKPVDSLEKLYISMTIK